MPCPQSLNGMYSNCSSNVGGIIVAYIANYGDVKSVTVDDATGKIKTLEMNDTAKFKTYEFKKNTGSLTSTLNVDAANGVNFVQSDLVLVFAKQEATKRKEVAALALGELAVIVKDANGKYWYLGYEDAVSSTAGTAETGTARTDGNKYTVTLTDYSSSYPYEIDYTLFSDLITAAPTPPESI